MRVCLIKFCSRPAKYRGLCLPCYHAAWKLVHAKETTWTALVEQGLAEEVQLAPSPFKEAFKKANKRRIPWDRIGI